MVPAVGPASGAPTLASTCREVADLLAASAPSWAERFRRLADRAERAPSSFDRSPVAADVLGLYGGMGSFNDLVLQDADGVLPGNDRLAALRRRLYDLAREEV